MALCMFCQTIVCVFFVLFLFKQKKAKHDNKERRMSPEDEEILDNSTHHELTEEEELKIYRDAFDVCIPCISRHFPIFSFVRSFCADTSIIIIICC